MSLVDGIGVRDEDCAHYGACFDAWAATASRITGWAHCPTGCPDHAPRERAPASISIGSSLSRSAQRS